MEQAWKPINEIVWECPYRFPAGIARSLLVKLADSKFLVYSPGDKKTALLAKQIVNEDAELFILEPKIRIIWRRSGSRPRIILSK